MSDPEVRDVAVIGGGIVGLATAWRLLQREPNLSLTVLEKEDGLARHQSGRNSGVLHSGIYYEPRSAKARLCRRGKEEMEAFCRDHAIPFERCGKVIVAVEEAELSRLDELLERGRANGVDCRKIGPDRLAEIEPHVRGLAAVHVPEAGIVDYREVCLELARQVQAMGGEIRLGARVVALEPSEVVTVLRTDRGEIRARKVVNCAGLHSDRIARKSGADPPAKIVPFRGEYYSLRREARPLCNGLVYPVPDPAFPFLGVHLTRQIGGGVLCGPNAVLAFAREGYRFTKVSPRDLWETLTYRGFLKLASRHWRTGLAELQRSLSKRSFLRALQRLVPDLSLEDLEPHPAGVRAQALLPDGSLADDFLIERTAGVVHVVNAPSPAATSSLAIASEIAGEHGPH